MKATKSDKTFRCAIYTRKSTEHGLDMEFNSLDAQREACEAYIKCQASEGWKASGKRYDDPAFSGGNMERPALQRLLKDVDAGLIDVIVVYKIDRLTRSLADFAKLVEIFDAKKVSFVAVTQQFNTTTSMGRLTLNVLLSFAQFERELSSERVRDKVAASRKKGKWMGGSVPLGYDRQDKKLVINQSEAKTVRMIFERYLALRSFQKLVNELNDKKIVSKARTMKGKMSGKACFTYGALAYLLKNRTYLGEAGHKGAWFPGEHEPIIDAAIFDQVQLLLKENSKGRTGRRQYNGALLTGLLFDDHGNRMSPSFTVKRGVRYPFYVGSAILRGRKAGAGTTRIAASELEKAVLNAIGSPSDVSEVDSPASSRNLIEATVDKIVVGPSQISIMFKQPDAAPVVIERPRQPSASVCVDESGCPPQGETNTSLVQAIVRAHCWLKLLSDGNFETIDALGQSVGVHPKIIRSGIRLAFLAPEVTTAIINGQQPAKLSLGDFVGPIPLSWQKQQQRYAA